MMVTPASGSTNGTVGQEDSRRGHPQQQQQQQQQHQYQHYDGNPDGGAISSSSTFQEPSHPSSAPSRQPCTVIFIGGWSPGPLVYLAPLLQKNNHILQANYKFMRGFPMPPIPGSWCCDWLFLAMIVTLVILVWTMSTNGKQRESDGASTIVALLFVAKFIAIVICIRLIVCRVVRYSVRRGADQLAMMVSQSAGPLIVVGFSWGGAVLAEYLCRHSSGAAPGAFLLIAPTTSLVASAAIQKDAALRRMNENAQVHVVHGTLDGAFCPNQHRWRNAPVNLTVLEDNHVFFQDSSRRRLGEILVELIQTST